MIKLKQNVKDEKPITTVTSVHHKVFRELNAIIVTKC